MISRWTTGSVDRTRDYFELRYGDLKEDSDAKQIPLAIVGPGDGTCFSVEWLVSLTDPGIFEAIESAKRELDFYLTGGHASDPWVYLKYHTTTAANLYSNVHWICCHPGR